MQLVPIIQIVTEVIDRPFQHVELGAVSRQKQHSRVVLSRAAANSRKAIERLDRHIPLFEQFMSALEEAAQGVGSPPRFVLPSTPVPAPLVGSTLADRVAKMQAATTLDVLIEEETRRKRLQELRDELQDLQAQLAALKGEKPCGKGKSMPKIVVGRSEARLVDEFEP